jgi:hypothetical protein
MKSIEPIESLVTFNGFDTFQPYQRSTKERVNVITVTNI